MLRTKFVADRRSNRGFMLLAKSCPRLDSVFKKPERLGAADIRRIISEHGEAVGYIAAIVADSRGLLKSKRALDAAIEPVLSRLDVPSAEAAEKSRSVGETVAAEADGAAERQAEGQPMHEPAHHDNGGNDRRLRQEVKRLERELGSAKKQIAQLTRKNQDLEQRLAKQAEELRAAAEQRETSRASLAKRENERKKLKQRVDELEKAKRTLEDCIERERQAWNEEREVHLLRRAATEEIVRAIEARAEALERQLAEERERREQVEGLLAETGLTRLLEGLDHFESVIAALEAFRNTIAAYQSRRAGEERSRRFQHEELQRRRSEAEEARRKQAEIEAAWRERERERLARMERAIFGSPLPEMVIIDGHNAILRAHGRQAEREQRPRFIESMRMMASRLAELDSGCRVVVCFDTRTAPSETIEAPNLVIRYCALKDGGADSAILQLMEAAHPRSRCLVVSTDRKHVWRDALRTRAERDSRIGIMDVEPLLDYLATLERIAAHGA